MIEVVGRNRKTGGVRLMVWVGEMGRGVMVVVGGE